MALSHVLGFWTRPSGCEVRTAQGTETHQNSSFCRSHRRQSRHRRRETSVPRAVCGAQRHFPRTGAFRPLCSHRPLFPPFLLTKPHLSSPRSVLSCGPPLPGRPPLQPCSFGQGARAQGVWGVEGRNKPRLRSPGGREDSERGPGCAGGLGVAGAAEPGGSRDPGGPERSGERRPRLSPPPPPPAWAVVRPGGLAKSSGLSPLCSTLFKQ